MSKFPLQSIGQADSTDYCIVAFAIIVIISVFQWIVDGRKNFTGPRVNLTGETVAVQVAEEREK